MAVPAALRKGSKRGAAEGEKGGALVHFFLRASEFVRNFESRKPRLEIRNLTPDSKLTYRRQSGCERGRRGIRGQRRAATRRDCWGENGVDDRAVVSILPANLNPPLFQPTSRKALERSSFTAAGRVRLKAKGRFVQALALFTFSGGGVAL
jgi:hypothetical protein